MISTLLTLIVALFWICIPFILLGTNSRLTKILWELQASNTKGGDINRGTLPIIK